MDLENLSKKEMEELLETWAEAQARKRLETMRASRKESLSSQRNW